MRGRGGKEFVCFKYLEWPDGRRKTLSIYRKGGKVFVEDCPMALEAEGLDHELELCYEGAKIVDTVTPDDIKRRRQKEQ